MKNKLATLGLCLACSSAVFASNAATTNLQETIGDLKARTELLEKRLRTLQHQSAKNKSTHSYFSSIPDSDLLIEMYAHGPAVVTSPALGVRRSAEDGGDLMINLPSINEDLVLLQIRKKMDAYALENKIAIPERPIIALSGAITGKTTYSRESATNKQNTTLALDSAGLDIVGEASPWATGSMSTTYDSSTDNIQIDRAFVTLGQLSKLPIYFTIGQVNLPFGSYGSYSVTKQIPTKNLGKTKGKAAVIGYYKDGLQAQAYIFDGYYGATTGRKIFDHTGFNLGYEYKRDKFNMKVGASIIGNFAEANNFRESSIVATTLPLTTRVCGIDANTKLGYGPFSVRAEYVSALESFNSADLTFNGKRARPSAMQVEGAWEFDIKNKPNTVAVGYGQSWQALAYKSGAQPQKVLFASYGVALIKNTILGLEYRYEKHYKSTDTWTGQSGNGSGKGGVANTFTASLSVFF